MLSNYQEAVELLTRNDFTGWAFEKEEIILEYKNGSIRLSEGFDHVYLIHALSVASQK